MKKVLAVIICLCFIFAGCGEDVVVCKESEKDLAYPLDFSDSDMSLSIDENHDTKDVVVINRKVFELEKIQDAFTENIHFVIDVGVTALDERLEIVLPQISVVSKWYTSSQILSHDRRIISKPDDKKGEEIMRGERSNALQLFILEVPKDISESVVFKWCHVNEGDKAFSEIDAKYTLELKFHIKKIGEK